MGTMSLWHWIIVLVLLSIPAVLLGLLVWLSVRVGSKRKSTPEARLQELALLKAQGLISAEEYEQRRQAIVRGV